MSFIGVQDVVYVANHIRGRTYDTVTVFCLLAARYWILTVLCGAAFNALEQVLPLNRASRDPRVGSARTPRGCRCGSRPMTWDWSFVLKILPNLMEGGRCTVLVTLASSAITLTG